jgi:uncharacterized membrane protein
MNFKHALLPSALILAADSAAAQTPTFTALPASSFAFDASNECGTVVVGTLGSQVFRWTEADGLVLIGGAGASSSGQPDIARDGSMITATTTGLDSNSRASNWAGSTSWTQLPDLGGMSGTSVSSSYANNGDGSVVVGLGWISAGTAHAFRWDAVNGTVDLGSTVANRSSRANDISADGQVIVGWQDQADGTRLGAKWINGVQSLFTYTDPNNVMFPCGEAQTVNDDGSIIAGNNVFGGDNSGWRWDASTGQVVLLPNLPGQPGSNRAIPGGMTDDGSVIVGTNGGSPFTRVAIIWLDNQPQDLLAYLTALGTPGIGGYTTLGTALGMSSDGKVIVGFGASPGNNGWIVRMPDHTPPTVGVAACFGDGSSIPCPCGNVGVTGRGCPNSVNASGALLTSTGVASLGHDTLKLLGSNMPSGNCVYIQGTTLTGGTVVYDGVNCSGGALLRLGVEENNIAGSSCYPKPGSGDFPVSVRGMITTPGTYTYQVYYRDNDPSFCPPGTANFTNASTLTWAP